MYMLQHGLFPSLLFLKQRPTSKGIRPEPEHLSIPQRCDVLSRLRTRDKVAQPPVYFVYGTVDDKVQPMEKTLEALDGVVDLEVEKLVGEDHQFDEDPRVECEKFREWLGRTLI